MTNKKPRVSLSKEQLELSLTSQINMLMMACESFDQGLEDAAKYAAVTLRVLLHHTGQSKSLLEQLGLRAGRYYSTTGRGYRPENLLSTTSSLTGMQIGPDGGKHVALLSDGPIPPKKILFADWWNEIVIADDKRRTMNRRELILHVANTEAAHVDPTLDEAYMDLSRNNSMGWNVRIGDEVRALSGPHLASIRQIAHEVLITLRQRSPQCFARAYEH